MNLKKKGREIIHFLIFYLVIINFLLSWILFRIFHHLFLKFTILNIRFVSYEIFTAIPKSSRREHVEVSRLITVSQPILILT